MVAPTKPKVSVILPVYNVEHYLPQALDSIVNQQLSDIEIIPVDDGSPDRCGELIDEYANRDARIRPIHKPNGGYGSAVNSGLAQANGEYIAIVESDDYLAVDMLSTLYRIASKGNHDIVKGSFFKVFGNRTERYNISHLIGAHEGIVEPKRSPRIMCMESSIWSALYRRDFIEANQLRMLESGGAAYQDTAWKFLTFAASQSTYFIDHPVYYYRVAVGGSSSASSKNPLAHFENYAHLQRELVRLDWFENVEKIFYLHQVIDFRFHCNRLDEHHRAIFCREAKKLIDAIEGQGIDVFDRGIDPDFIDAIADEIKPLYQAIKTGTPWRRKQTLWNRRAWVAWLYPRLRRSVFVQWAWRLIKRVALTYPMNLVIRKLAQAEYQNLQRMRREVLLPLIESPIRASTKNVLVVMPYVSTNAYFNLVEYLDRIFLDLGYKLHVVVHNDHGEAERKPWWESFYYIRSVSGKFLSMRRDPQGRIINDGHKIDDWCSDELLQFVSALNGFLRFEVCIVHYVLFSKVFEVLDDDALKLLVTHDVFSRRNSRLLEHGMLDSVWFSTTEEEESKGLQRASRVLAIQEAEAEFFSRLVGADKVVTIPWIPPKHYLDNKTIHEGRLVLGYFASSYTNNIKTLDDFHGLFVGRKALTQNFRLLVGGRICEALARTGKKYSGAEFFGAVDDVKSFYSQCDLVVNPDTFESGLKLKGVEALSYGLPLVTTLQATRGLGLTSKYHLCENLEKVGAALEEIARDRSLLSEMAEASRQAYDKLRAKYNARDIIEDILSDADRRRNPRGSWPETPSSSLHPSLPK